MSESWKIKFDRKDNIIIKDFDTNFLENHTRNLISFTKSTAKCYITSFDESSRQCQISEYQIFFFFLPAVVRLTT